MANRMDYLNYRRYFLAHHGVKGQKWGVRRYQNEDGTLTDEGRKKLERIGALHGYTSGVEKSIYESARAGKQLLFTKDQVNTYQSYKKELDDILNKLDKENVHILQKRYSKKGEEFVSIAFDTGKDIDDVDKRSVYSVRLFR